MGGRRGGGGGGATVCLCISLSGSDGVMVAKRVGVEGGAVSIVCFFLLVQA